MKKKKEKKRKEIPSFQRDGESRQDIYNRSADFASEENQQNQNMHGVFHFKTCNLSKKIGVRSCTCSQELLSLIMTSVSGFCRPIIIRRDNWKCSHLDSSDWLNFLRSTIVSTNHTTVIIFVKVHSCNAKDFGRTFQFSLILAVKMTRWLQGPEMVASRKDSENRAGQW